MSMMRRTPLRPRRPEPRPATQSTYTPRPRAVAVPSGEVQMAAPQPKDASGIDKRIRESARGEDCTVRIVGACFRDTEHTIWSHAPLGAAGKGMGIKSIDLCGAYCCTACDAVVDGQAAMPPGYTREAALLDWFMGHARSLVRLRQKGLA